MFNNFILCSSTGIGKKSLTSFDNALLKSGIANYNLVKVSSILPANAIRQETVTIHEGSILHTAYAQKTILGRNNFASAAVAVGIPVDRDKIGVIMEFSGECSKDDAKVKVCQMVKEAMHARGYEISEILYAVEEIWGSDEEYTTAFAALAMW